MWNDDIDLPSVEDRDDDIENEIPEHDLEWLAGWEDETTPTEIELREVFGWLKSQHEAA